MPAVTRNNIDTTVGTCNIGLPCCPHGRNGINTSGCRTVIVNGYQLHTKTHQGSCRCPHGGTYTSTEGSPTVIAEGNPVTRIGDTTTCNACGCTGTHDSGSDNVIADDKR